MSAVRRVLATLVTGAALAGSAAGAPSVDGVAPAPASARAFEAAEGADAAASDIEAGRIPPDWNGLDEQLNRIRRQGVTVIVKRGGVSDEDHRRLAEAKDVTGAARAEAIIVSGRFDAAAFAFDRYPPLVDLIEHLPECVYAGGGVVFVPRQPVDEHWTRLADAARSLGGFRHAEETSRREQVLIMLASQMEAWQYLYETYAADRGEEPAVDDLSWELLTSVDPAMLAYEPTNLFVADGASRIIAVVDGVRQRADRVSSARAGWVWDARAKRLTPVGVDPAEIDRALVDAMHFDELMLIDHRAHETVRRLRTLRTAIRAFSMRNGRPPEFRERGWSALVEGGFLPKPLPNPMLPIPNAQRIAVIDQPRVQGDAVAVDEAGWVWNEADRRLYAVGYGDDALEEITMNSRGPHPMFTRKALAQQRAEAMMGAIERYRMAQGEKGDAAWPTLDALRREGGPLHDPPRNPFNGLKTIELAEWRAGDPPTNGETGWRYDPKAGKVWPNSPDMRSAAARAAGR